MAAVGVEIVVRTEHIARNDRGEQAAVLLCVGVIGHVNHALGIAVAVVWRVRRTVMYLSTKTLGLNQQFLRLYHCFVNGVACFVRKYASWEAGNDFSDAGFVADLQHIVVYVQVFALKNLQVNFGCDEGMEDLQRMTDCWTCCETVRPPSPPSGWRVSAYVSQTVPSFVCSHWWQN